MRKIYEFINGDIPLWQSYWIVLWLLTYLIGKFVIRFHDLVESAEAPFFLLRSFLMLAWLSFAATGVWRSANNYSGLKVFSYLAKIQAFLVWCCVFIVLLNFFFGFFMTLIFFDN